MIKFDDFDAARQHKPLCIACEEMLADALDETLSPADQAWFDRHIDTCILCSRMLADAQRGAAWLEMLKFPRPEPSAQLMQRILAQTSNPTAGLESEAQPASKPRPAKVLPFRTRMPVFPSWANPIFQPRLAMTAAMAFFSIALTLNLTGVRLDELKSSTLNPTHLKRTYYEANAQAVRYYDNLRVVQVMEARVDDLRESSDDNPQPIQQPVQKAPANSGK
jgi:hypothetical protein